MKEETLSINNMIISSCDMREWENIKNIVLNEWITRQDEAHSGSANNNINDNNNTY